MDGTEIWCDIFVFVLIFLDRLHNYSCAFTTWFNIQWASSNGSMPFVYDGNFNKG